MSMLARPSFGALELRERCSVVASGEVQPGETDRGRERALSVNGNLLTHGRGNLEQVDLAGHRLRGNEVAGVKQVLDLVDVRHEFELAQMTPRSQSSHPGDRGLRLAQAPAERGAYGRAESGRVQVEPAVRLLH